MRRFTAFLSDEGGATAMEYALIASLIALAIIGAMVLFSTNVSTMWGGIATHVKSSVP